MVGAEAVMFIRHGEKPGDDGPPHGVNPHGDSDSHSLSVRGWTRAGALARLFAAAPTPSHPQLVVPQRIVATKRTHDYLSKREVDTASPLALRLAIPVDEDYDHSQAAELSESIMSDPRPTLVVWHHGSMSKLLSHFPLSNPGDVPEHWPEDRFDLIWMLSRGPGEQQYRFASMPQALLDGDVDVATSTDG